MLRFGVILMLIISTLSPKSYSQEWLSAYNKSLDYYNNDQFEDALSSCKDAFIRYKREANTDHANYRAILRQLSVICYGLDQLNDGQKYAEQEVESWRSASKVNEGSYIDALDNLGLIYSALGKYEEAISVQSESYSSAKLNPDKTDIEKAVIEGHLAEVLFAAGKLKESEAHFISCLMVLDEVEDIPGDYISFCYSYGSLCVEQESYDDAIKYLSMLFQWYEETEQDLLIINANMALGTAYTQAGDLAKGEHCFLLAKTAFENDENAGSRDLIEVTKLLALNLEQQGKHDSAQELLASINNTVLAEGGASEEQAYFLNSQATVLLNSGKINESIHLYDQALAMLDSLQLTRSEAYAAIGLNAAKANNQAMNLIIAAELAENVRSYQEKESIYYYLLTAELASVLHKQGDYDAANKEYEIILNADNNGWPARDKGRLMNKTASFYQMQGKYEISNKLYNEALAVVSPEKYQALYQSLMFNYITLLQAQGNLSEAQKLLDDLRVSIGSDNPQIYLGILRNIGSLAQSKGDYATANSRYKEALSIAKDLSGENSTQYADILLRIATLEKDLGNYQTAEPMFIQVSEIVAQADGKGHPNYASVVNNMGILFQQMGNYDKAETNFLEAITIYKSAFGEDSPDYVLTLENLATLYELIGDEDKALDILASTLESNKKIYGETNPNYAISLHNYASLLQKTDRKDEAFNMLIKVLELQEQSAGRLQPSYANSLHNLAILAQEQENYQLADSLINEVLVIRGHLFDVSHPSYTSALFGKAVLLQVINKYDDAWDIYNQVIDQYLGQIDKYFPSLSEKEKNAFYATVTPVINRYKEFCVEYYTNYKASPEVLNRLYDVQLATKALLLNAVNKTRNRIMNSGDEQLINEFNQWTGIKKQLVNYYNYSKEQIAAEGIDILLLEEEANNIEKSLSKSSELFAGEFDKQNPTWQKVVTHLESDEAAIELIRIQRNGIEDSVTYVALGLLPNAVQPELVILPYGNLMEGKYYNYYKNTVKYEIKDNLSFDVYWQRIDKMVKGVRTIYISADGVYNKININTIYDQKANQYVIEDYFVKYLSSTRDLLQTLAVKPVMSQQSILCLGDPAYDLNGKPGSPALLDDRQRSQLSMNQISPLPGTKKEISYIDSLLKANNWQVNSYLGSQAMEEQLKGEGSPKVIHLATHGFFMKDLGSKSLEKQAGRNEYEKNPLFRSGLLFAGASNNLENTENDGILTAYEAMNLHLDNTELVVLSACETALGDVKNGEGVYGLQRALQVAGAQTLIMSLWKVNDEATMELMSMFYTNWVGGDDIYVSMQKAQKEMLNEGRAPYYWGAFIMIGG
ncbi:MAG: hypothetical protein DRI71_01760 [Bacteroidetes bacterium]|nr:MAG: hypothetical protein DRI71_01760 [Bacteroidota bacterium]